MGTVRSVSSKVDTLPIHRRILTTKAPVESLLLLIEHGVIENVRFMDGAYIDSYVNTMAEA